jgi:hypothetical protein
VEGSVTFAEVLLGMAMGFAWGMAIFKGVGILADKLNRPLFLPGLAAAVAIYSLLFPVAVFIMNMSVNWDKNNEFNHLCPGYY